MGRRCDSRLLSVPAQRKARPERAEAQEFAGVETDLSQGCFHRERGEGWAPSAPPGKRHEVGYEPARTASGPCFVPWLRRRPDRARDRALGGARLASGCRCRRQRRGDLLLALPASPARARARSGRRFIAARGLSFRGLNMQILCRPPEERLSDLGKASVMRGHHLALRRLGGDRACRWFPRYSKSSAGAGGPPLRGPASCSDRTESANNPAITAAAKRLGRTRLIGVRYWALVIAAHTALSRRHGCGAASVRASGGCCSRHPCSD
jgi:hypothetical protein